MVNKMSGGKIPANLIVRVFRMNALVCIWQGDYPLTQRLVFHVNGFALHPVQMEMNSPILIDCIESTGVENSIEISNNKRYTMQNV